ncbi:MAG: NAD(+) synthase [Defluviitaleaceae bacterium]|nr:NAD(+) synthase [Defluviitaleaceae bacterium]
MRDYAQETARRVEFIRRLVEESGVRGIVFGNSGGKDAALVGILCKMACSDTVGVILPCGVSRNYESDRLDALALSKQYKIAHSEVDLQPARDALLQGLYGVTQAADTADLAEADWTASKHANVSIAPRLRMVALYAIANAENRLVAGTGNRSERHMGYTTKWGDGAWDFNPIMDLTATEIFEFLQYLGAPASIIRKAPSAGLFEGQTDEMEMGITYATLDHYLLTGEASDADRAVIDRFHRVSAHKRAPQAVYGAST